jgi:hypothetical protein
MMFGMGLVMMLVYFHETVSVSVMMIDVGICLSSATSVAKCLFLLHSPLQRLPQVGRKSLWEVEIWL